MKKIVLSVIVAFQALTINAQCSPQATISENFNDFTSNDFPQNCWNKITEGPMVYIDNDDDNETDRYATFYSLFSPNVDAYLVAPQLSVIDGMHQISFDVNKLTGGSITLQLGTLSDPLDASTFQPVGEVMNLEATDEPTTIAPVVIPASETHKYVAFKFNAGAVHEAAIIDNIVWEPVCTTTESIDEDFNGFTSDDLPQNCWTYASEGPFISISNDEGSNDRYISFYSYIYPDTPAYIATPQLSAINGNYSLTFDAAMQTGSAPGTVTIQAGTLTNPADTGTFTAVGNAVTISSATIASHTIDFPQSSATYAAFKVWASGQHVAAKIDNVQWQTTAGTSTNKVADFSIYPNPSVNKNITVNQSIAENALINIYNNLGAKVLTAQIQSGPQELNLSALNTGIYIVSLRAGNTVTTQKLIIQ